MRGTTIKLDCTLGWQFTLCNYFASKSKHPYQNVVVVVDEEMHTHTHTHTRGVHCWWVVGETESGKEGMGGG